MDTQTIEGNKVIAEFMGLYVNTESYNAPVVDLPDDSYCYLDEMEYHSRWDQLMPVVEKVSKISIKGRSYVKVEIVPSGFVKISELRYTPIFTNVSVEGSLIKACWKAVVQFIQWYKTIKT